MFLIAGNELIAPLLAQAPALCKALVSQYLIRDRRKVTDLREVLTCRLFEIAHWKMALMYREAK